MAEDYTFDPWPAILSAFLVLLQVVLVMTPGVWYTRRVRRRRPAAACCRELQAACRRRELLAALRL